MRATKWSVLLLVTLAALPLSGQQVAGWTADEQMKVKAVGAARVSPDGRRVLFTVNEPVNQLP